MGDNLLAAYREYLDKMFDKSADLVNVDIDTVPDGLKVSLTWLEFANFA